MGGDLLQLAQRVLLDDQLDTRLPLHEVFGVLLYLLADLAQRELGAELLDVAVDVEVLDLVFLAVHHHLEAHPTVVFLGRPVDRCQQLVQRGQVRLDLRLHLAELLHQVGELLVVFQLVLDELRGGRELLDGDLLLAEHHADLRDRRQHAFGGLHLLEEVGRVLDHLQLFVSVDLEQVVEHAFERLGPHGDLRAVREVEEVLDQRQVLEALLAPVFGQTHDLVDDLDFFDHLWVLVSSRGNLAQELVERVDFDFSLGEHHLDPRPPQHHLGELDELFDGRDRLADGLDRREQLDDVFVVGGQPRLEVLLDLGDELLEVRTPVALLEEDLHDVADRLVDVSELLVGGEDEFGLAEGAVDLLKVGDLGEADPVPGEQVSRDTLEPLELLDQLDDAVRDFWVDHVLVHLDHGLNLS